MKTALALVLVSSLAWGADDAPKRAMHVAPGFVVTESSWVFTDEGKAKVDATLQRQWQELEKLRAENITLQADVLRVSAEPGLTWKGALLLVGAGVVTGLAVGIPVALAVRR